MPVWPVVARDRDGCVLIFPDEESLLTRIEVIDIEDDEYELLDSEGRPLTVRLTDKDGSKTWRSLGRVEISIAGPESEPQVSLHELNAEKPRPDLLREILVTALVESGVPEAELIHRPLREIVARALRERRGDWLNC
jgi:hypothetical protein